MKFDLALKTTVQVRFSNPEHAKEYFLKGSEWSETFYILENMKELVEFVGRCHVLSNSYRPFIEGIGRAGLTSTGGARYYFDDNMPRDYIEVLVIDDYEPDSVELLED